jgi:hypothetical protein
LSKKTTTRLIVALFSAIVVLTCAVVRWMGVPKNIYAKQLTDGLMIMFGALILITLIISFNDWFTRIMLSRIRQRSANRKNGVGPVLYLGICREMWVVASIPFILAVIAALNQYWISAIGLMSLGLVLTETDRRCHKSMKQRSTGCPVGWFD